MAYNKVIYRGETLIDLTDLDVTEADVAQGKKFIKANGVKSTGTSTGGGSSDGLKQYISGNTTELTESDLAGISKIDNYVFYRCSSLASIGIPNSVTRIGEGAFYGCHSLTSVTIPNSVTAIGRDAFFDCSKLTSVYLTDIASWCDIDFVSTYSNPLFYAKNLYLNGELVTNLVIPDGVTRISVSAFTDCRGLTSVTIPDSVTWIGDLAFKDCSGLTDVYYVGSESSWNSIYIGNSNTYLTNATIHFIGKTESYNNVETRTESNSKGTTLYITTNS